MATRNPRLDQVKGLACLFIIFHHLAFYGPMTDVLQPFAAGVLSWFREYARMAVQVFLVLGGYLSAATLAPDGIAKHRLLLQLLGKRFTRLVTPYAVALVITVLITETVRGWGFSHASMSAPPTPVQFGAHLFLLHGLFGWESLSAGVWYVAIDFQLFALAAVWFKVCSTGQGADFSALPRRVVSYAQVGIALLTLASLWVWNRNSGLDVWALYFFGAYGLGMMAWWATHNANAAMRKLWCLLMLLLVTVALALEWRDRVALAGITAMVLVASNAVPWFAVGGLCLLKPLQRLGQISYSVFIMHFGASLLVNAVVHLLWPTSVWANAVGVVCAVALSIGLGALLYRWVESVRTPMLFPAFKEG